MAATDASVSSIISDHDTGQSDDKLAAAVLDELLDNHVKIVRDLLMPLIRQRVVMQRRQRVHRKERRVHETIKDAVLDNARRARGIPAKTRRTRAGETADLASDFRHLFGTGFNVPRRGWIKWEEATVADHQARREALSLKAKGLQETSDLHRLAIERIQAAGVKTLGQIKVQQGA